MAALRLFLNSLSFSNINNEQLTKTLKNTLQYSRHSSIRSHLQKYQFLNYKKCVLNVVDGKFTVSTIPQD